MTSVFTRTIAGEVPGRFVWRDEQVSEVTQIVGRALQAAFDPPRIGTAIPGFEVPHCHVHVVPLRELADLDLARADADPDPAALDDAAERIGTALRDLGHDDHVG